MPEKSGIHAKRINERSATHRQGGTGTQVVELVTVPRVEGVVMVRSLGPGRRGWARER